MKAVAEARSVLLEQVEKRLVRQASRLERFEQGKEHFLPMCAELQQIEEVTISLDYDWDLHVQFAGGKALLKRVLTIVYRHKFAPTSWPDKTATSWFVSCEKGFVSFYLSFSSTECQRVKVGTRMQEVDVFETRCAAPMMEPDPALSQAQPISGVLVDDIPF